MSVSLCVRVCVCALVSSFAIGLPECAWMCTSTVANAVRSLLHTIPLSCFERIDGLIVASLGVSSVHTTDGRQPEATAWPLDKVEYSSLRAHTHTQYHSADCEYRTHLVHRVFPHSLTDDAFTTLLGQAEQRTIVPCGCCVETLRKSRAQLIGGRGGGTLRSG
jgi:hypothetical protein